MQRPNADRFPIRLTPGERRHLDAEAKRAELSKDDIELLARVNVSDEDYTPPQCEKTVPSATRDQNTEHDRQRAQASSSLARGTAW